MSKLGAASQRKQRSYRALATARKAAETVKALANVAPVDAALAARRMALDVVAQARRAAPRALKILIEIAADSSDDRARIRACEVILDRAYGKAPQTVLVHRELSDTDLKDLASQILRASSISAELPENQRMTQCVSPLYTSCGAKPDLATVTRPPDPGEGRVGGVIRDPVSNPPEEK